MIQTSTTEYAPGYGPGPERSLGRRELRDYVQRTWRFLSLGPEAYNALHSPCPPRRVRRKMAKMTNTPFQPLYGYVGSV